MFFYYPLIATAAFTLAIASQLLFLWTVVLIMHLLGFNGIAFFIADCARALLTFLLFIIIFGLTISGACLLFKILVVIARFFMPTILM